MPAPGAGHSDPPDPASRGDLLCPRCDYDLRGAVSAWRDACPVEGRCAECGLEFEWRSIFVREEHPWLIEYHWKRRSFVSVWLTSIRLFQPHRFWSAVRLEHPSYLRPAAALVVFLLVMPLWFRVLGGVALASAEHRRYGGGGGYFTLFDVLVDALWSTDRWYSMSVDWLVIYPVPAAYLFILLWMPAMALCFFLIPVSLRKARVRRAHIQRIALYGLAWMTLPVLALALVQCVAHLANAATTLLLFERAFDYYPWEFPLTIGFVPTLPLVFAPFAWWWWDVACRRYLRLPDGRLVAALLTVLSGLIVLVAFVLSARLLGHLEWWVDNL